MNETPRKSMALPPFAIPNILNSLYSKSSSNSLKLFLNKICVQVYTSVPLLMIKLSDFKSIYNSTLTSSSKSLNQNTKKHPSKDQKPLSRETYMCSEFSNSSNTTYKLALSLFDRALN